MYRHCPACTRNLGSNEALEHFPVGRRLAYDLARGRLWVLCPRCRAWNLAPLEERWEAVEEAERRFETAQEGVSTENIALGRLADGTELVRIGQARAPELAGWRYAERIRDRWRRVRWSGYAGGAFWAFGSSAVGGSVLGPLILAGLLVDGGWRWARAQRELRLEFPADGMEGAKGADRVHAGAGPRVQLGPRELTRLHLVTLPGAVDAGRDGAPGGEDDPSGWGLEVRRPGRSPIRIPAELRNRALRLYLLRMNRELGKPLHLERAVERVREAGDPGRVASLAARDLGAGRAWENHVGWPFSDPTALSGADPVLRLALEIAANDEVERLALEGELFRLELEWKEAEELATISDALLLPPWVRERIREWRDGAPAPIATPRDLIDSEEGTGGARTEPPVPSPEPAPEPPPRHDQP